MNGGASSTAVQERKRIQLSPDRTPDSTGCMCILEHRATILEREQHLAAHCQLPDIEIQIIAQPCYDSAFLKQDHFLTYI